MNKALSRTRKNLLYALVGGSLFWPLSPTADAAETTQPQSAPEQREFALEGVEVTAAKASLDNGYVAKRSSAATKTDTPLEETARSISIITREQMDARGITDMFSILSYTPGFSDMGYNNRSNRYGYYSLRGFIGTSFINGLRSAGGGFAISNFDPYSFERVDVLRGPAGILYGTTSPGGIVNQVSKRPSAESLRELRLQAGSDSQVSGALDIGGPASDDGKLLFRLTALTSDEDLVVDHSSGKRHLVAPALTWQPNAATSLTLLTHFQKDDIKGDSYSSISQYNPGHALYGYKSGTMFIGEPDFDRFIREDKQIGYVLEHRFNDTWSVTQNARHSDIFCGMKVLTVAGVTDGVLSRTADYYKSDLTADLIDTHFTAKWTRGGVQHTTLLGFDYYNYNYDYTWLTGPAPSLNLDTLNYGQNVAEPTTGAYLTDTKIKQTGWYLQDQLKFGRWTAIAGGRYDRYDSSTLNRLKGSRTVIDQNAFTGRLGLVYDAGNGLFPYISYDESFEGLSGSDRYGRTFDPTTGRQYELGLQYVPENSKARFTAAIFDLRQQNTLTSDPLNETLGGSFSVQTGEIAAKGLELEATVEAAKGLNITAAYTYMPDHEITRDNDPAKIGRRTANIPRHSASLWIDTSPSGKDRQGWSYGAGLRYIGSRYNSANTRKTGDTVVADAMIRYDRGDWRYTLNAHNLFDKHYNMSPGNTSDGLDPGRIVRLTATCRW